jgi:glycerol-3-phosphate acyltransferase PlsY
MIFALLVVTAFLIAYLVGSIPFGVVLARLAGGVDIRKVGSGNIGATNVARVLGAKFGLMVLVLDCLKGALPTALLPVLLAPSSGEGSVHLAVVSGVAAIVGHMFPCWIGFRGGKGVATALGVAIVLAPIATGVAFLVFAGCFAIWRIVSVSSIAAACAFCAAELCRLLPAPFDEAHWSVAVFSVIVPLLIVVRHRSNLGRIWRREEPRFQFGGKK